MRRNFSLTFTYEFNYYRTPRTHSTSSKFPKLDNKLPENCIFNKGKTGCGATTLAIENRVPTLIAVPTVNLIKNKLPEHADLLGGLWRCHQPRDSRLSENARPLKNHGHL